MEFTGFTQATADFFWELAFHNERPWFNEHKEEFLRTVKEPFDALAHATLAELQQRFPEEPWQVHVSRIYRDARRLFGRGPYKDYLWFSIWSGVDRRDGAGFWFDISGRGYSYGTGFWGASAAELEEYRRYIDEHPDEMKKLARAVNRQDVFTLSGEEYKRPKGDAGELLNPWYNKRSLELSAEFDFGGDALSPELPNILADGYAFLMPYYTLFRRFRATLEEDRV